MATDAKALLSIDNHCTTVPYHLHLQLPEIPISNQNETKLAARLSEKKAHIERIDSFAVRLLPVGLQFGVSCTLGAHIYIYIGTDVRYQLQTPKSQEALHTKEGKR